MKDLDWNSLKTLLAVAKHRRVPAAASELGVAPSTVYRQLEAMEGVLGGPLFDRRAPWTLTPLGADLAARATRMEAELLPLRPASTLSTVTLTTMEAVVDVLAKPLAEVSRSHPELRVVVRIGTSVESLANREADIAIRAMAHPPDNLVGRRLFNAEFAVFSTEQATGWVVFDHDLASTPQGRWEQAHVRPDHVRLATSHRGMFAAAVRQGVGQGVLPVAMARELPGIEQRGALLPFVVPVWILTHPDAREIPAVRGVLDALYATIRRDPRPR